MSRYYDRQGKPMTMAQWSEMFEESGKRVGSTERDGVQVSTVWLGLDHSWGDGPPLIFETMIFGGEHDQYQKRYSTEAEAIAGHAKAVALAFGPEAKP